MCLKGYSILNNLNPSFMRNIFTPRDSNRPVRNSTINNLEIKRRKTTTYGSKSLSILGSQIWNNLPLHLKCAESLLSFKRMIKKGDGTKCMCNDCTAT